jgi:hypothetical protein
MAGGIANNIPPAPGAHMLTIPSAPLFAGIPGGLPVGFPVTLQVDLFNMVDTMTRILRYYPPLLCYLPPNIIL